MFHGKGQKHSVMWDIQHLGLFSTNLLLTNTTRSYFQPNEKLHYCSELVGNLFVVFNCFIIFLIKKSYLLSLDESIIHCDQQESIINSNLEKRKENECSKSEKKWKNLLFKYWQWLYTNFSNLFFKKVVIIKCHNPKEFTTIHD